MKSPTWIAVGIVLAAIIIGWTPLYLHNKSEEEARCRDLRVALLAPDASDTLRQLAADQMTRQ